MEVLTALRLLSKRASEARPMGVGAPRASLGAHHCQCLVATAPYEQPVQKNRRHIRADLEKHGERVTQTLLDTIYCSSVNKTL